MDAIAWAIVLFSAVLVVVWVALAVTGIYLVSTTEQEPDDADR